MYERANEHESVITHSIVPSGGRAVDLVLVAFRSAKDARRTLFRGAKGDHIAFCWLKSTVRLWRIAILVMICLAGKVSLLNAADPPSTLEYAELLDRAPLAKSSSETGAGDAEHFTFNVSGRVVDETGQPINDAVVVLTVSADVVARTRSDSNGEYRLESILHTRSGRSVGQRNDAITLGTIVAADKQGRMNWAVIKYGTRRSLDDRRRYDFLAAEPIPVLIQMRQDLTLGASNPLTGVVVDRDDRPLSGVQVELAGLHQGGPDTIDREFFAGANGNLQTVTGADGVFLFPHIPSGMIAAVALSHPDHYRTFAAMATSPGVSEFPSWFDNGSIETVANGPARFHLNEKVVVNGKVVNQKQEPLAGAEIQFEYFDNDRTQSDAEGNFSIVISAKSLDSRNNLPSISSLQLRWPQDSPYASSWPKISREQIVDQVPLTIVAEDAIEIHGQVIASDDHQPVADLPLKIQPWERRFPPAIETQTDSEGRFKVNAQAGRWLITCGPKAGFDLLATDPNNGTSNGIDPQSQRIIDLVAPERSSSMAIIIDRTPALVVHVVDSSGESVAGAVVNILRQEERSRVRFTRHTNPAPIVPASVTDEDGQCLFHLPTLMEGRWLITAESPAEAPRLFAEKELRSNRYESAELTLLPGISLRGRVLLDDAPLANAEVVLTDSQSFVDDPSRRISTATSNEAGEYELFAPEPGDFAWRNQPARYLVNLVGLPELTQCHIATQFVSLPLDSSKQADAFPIKDFQAVTATGEASGRVVDESGRPIEGAVVRIYPYSTLLGDPAQQGNATTDAAGAFHWIGVGPGKFKPVVVINGHPRSPEVTIEAGQQNVEIVIPRE